MASSPIDLARTAAFGDTDTPEGRQALIEVFRLYLDSMSKACAAMRHSREPDRVRSEAHRAKGASGVVGAIGMWHTLADVEARAAAGETLTPAEYDDIERQLSGLRTFLSATLGVEHL